MTILRIEVCQMCKEIGKPVQKYRVGDMATLARLPLCADCLNTPFSQLLAARDPRRRLAPMVTSTMEDVAAAKRRSPRKAKPRVARKG